MLQNGSFFVWEKRGWWNLIRPPSARTSIFDEPLFFVGLISPGLAIVGKFETETQIMMRYALLVWDFELTMTTTTTRRVKNYAPYRGDTRTSGSGPRHH